MPLSVERTALEQGQVWLYLCTIIAGLAFGFIWPRAASVLDILLWPTLAVLLYATFLQVPLLHLREAFRDHRFLLASLAGNFVLLPLLVWGLTQVVALDPAVRLGVLLVLLMPCTDWFITFSQQGGGQVARALAITPVNLFLQLLLLPFYLWLMADREALDVVARPEFLPALAVVVLPLLLAAMSERWIEVEPRRAVLRGRLAWWPVPLLALVLFLVAAVQAGTVRDAGGLLATLVPLFLLYLCLALGAARLLARLSGVTPEAGRTIAFSFGTRNSFLVLPLALALPAGWEAAALVIVAQSLVELFGMLVYLRIVPRLF
ncbi:MAG TPA: bile acid:sodium symporter [Noviherbaspirillum sp.]|nr:bile acid:sodium symporter [Noviherbaspirillum sp.]